MLKQQIKCHICHLWGFSAFLFPHVIINKCLQVLDYCSDKKTRPGPKKRHVFTFKWQRPLVAVGKLMYNKVHIVRLEWMFASTKYQDGRPLFIFVTCNSDHDSSLLTMCLLTMIIKLFIYCLIRRNRCFPKHIWQRGLLVHKRNF